MATETELAWAAGFFDGEGSISVVRRSPTKSYWYPLTQVGNRERAPVERFREIVGTGFITTRREDGFHLWAAASRKAEKVLLQIAPYLVNKRKQAELALLSRKFYTENRTDIDLALIASQIRVLNSKKGRRKPILGLNRKAVQGWSST